MTNDQMKAGRFAKWANARARLAYINAAFDDGKDVYVCTQTRQTKYNSKHREMFRAVKSGLYVQAGKSWTCLDFTKIIAV